MAVFSIGNARIRKVHEMDLNGMLLSQLMPGFDASDPAALRDRLPEGTFDGEGHAFLSMHVWLVEHDGRIILIDAGAGNHKSRPQQKALDHLDNPFLERLAEAGVRPQDVDYVLMTHIHSDHAGWNTRRDGENWVPTFPNAITVCSEREWRYGAALTDGDDEAVARIRAEAGMGQPIRTPVPGTFADSMRPLERTGRLRLVEVDGTTEVLPGIRFLPVPGHSIDHAAIELVSDGATAIFGADTVHHAVEVAETDLVSCFCEFPEQTRASRLKLFERASAPQVTYFSGHFPRSSAGRIERREDGYGWQFLEPS